MKPRRIDLSQYDQATEHDALGLPPLEETITHAGPHPFRRDVLLLIALPALALLIYGLGHWLLPAGWQPLLSDVSAGLQSQGFWLAVSVGLFAQIIDGALGMAYGITATTFLLSTGVSPAAASASVHMAEIFTTGFSGISHWRFGNVDKALFKRLLIPGMVGAVTGAWIITSVDGNTIKPWISAYLIIMGLYVLSKAFRKIKQRKEAPKHVAALALTGGFVDSVGGGGWGTGGHQHTYRHRTGSSHHHWLGQCRRVFSLTGRRHFVCRSDWLYALGGYCWPRRWRPLCCTFCRMVMQTPTRSHPANNGGHPHYDYQQL
jgi:hypothetical protein